MSYKEIKVPQKLNADLIAPFIRGQPDRGKKTGAEKA